jgi:hypothetical protein
MTATKKIRPNFPDVVIIGGQRCGTSWLYEGLRSHPDVWGPPVAPEPKLLLTPLLKYPAVSRNYLDSVVSGPLEDFYGDAPEGKLLIEKTTRYLPSHAACLGLLDANPNAKIICMARNPVDRAWSHWRYSYTNKVETRSYKEAIGLEAARHQSLGWDYTHNFAYVSHGMYAFHLLQHGWTGFEESLLLVKYEELEHPGTLMTRVLRFLGLDPDDLSPGLASFWNTAGKMGFVNEGDPLNAQVTGDVMETAELLDWLLAPQVEAFEQLYWSHKNAPEGGPEGATREGAEVQ